MKTTMFPYKLLILLMYGPSFPSGIPTGVQIVDDTGRIYDLKMLARTLKSRPNRVLKAIANLEQAGLLKVLSPSSIRFKTIPVNYRGLNNERQ